MANSEWQPGNTACIDFLAKLTPAEYKAHFDKRTKRAAMKKAMDSVILQQQDKWLAELNTAAIVMLKKAIEQGDVQAFVAIWDRLIGKPTNEVKIDLGAPLPWNDDFDED